MRGYDPYTYRPMMRYFYQGAPLPSDIADAVSANPRAANHIQAVFGFTQWLNERFPAVSQSLAIRNPRALDAVKAVKGGSVSPTTSKSGLSGLGDIVDSSPATDWGKVIADTAKSVLAFKSQQDIVNLNIKRAEQGLPPIDSGSVAPQLNVGLSPQVQTMMLWGFGGLLALGIVSVMKGRK